MKAKAKTKTTAAKSKATAQKRSPARPKSAGGKARVANTGKGEFKVLPPPEHEAGGDAAVARAARKPAKAAKPAPAPQDRPAPAPAPAAKTAKAAPAAKTAGLTWSEPRATGAHREWYADDPDGAELPPARIRELSNGYLGVQTPTYFSYRSGIYLGANSSLEEAKERVEKKLVANRVAPLESGRFTPELALTEGEGKYVMEKMERIENEEREAKGLKPKTQFDSVGVRVSRAVLEANERARATFRSMQDGEVGRSTGGATSRPEKPQRQRGEELTGTIRVVTKRNPRKPNTKQHMRYECLMRYDGKTVAEYLRDPDARKTALVYAMEGGHVKLEG